MAINFLNTVAVDENVLFVDTVNDRVGIGTDSPSAKLHVEGDIELISGFSIGSNDGNYWQRIRTVDNTPTTTNAFNFETRNGSGNYLTHMVIRNDGNVGINTTSPLSKFQVNGQASVLGNSFNGLAYFNGTDALASYNTANKIVMSSNGSADGLYTGGLHLTRRALTQQGHFGSGIRGISVGTVLQDNALELYTSTNTEQNATRLKITSTGNVGIGTTSPSAKLDVVQATTANGAAALHLIGPNTNPNLTTSVLIIEQSDGKKITMDGNDIDVSSGDLFINDYSGEDVTFGGQIKVKGLGNPVGDSYISNGNFGVGTTSPQEKLHVVEEVEGNTLIEVENTRGNSAAGVKFTSASNNYIAYTSSAGNFEILNSQTGKVNFVIAANGQGSFGNAVDTVTNSAFSVAGGGGISATKYINQRVVWATGFSHATNNSSAYYYFPVAGYLLTTSNQYYNGWIAPYAGRVKRITIRNVAGTSSAPTATTVNFRVSVNGSVIYTGGNVTIVGSSYNKYAMQDITPSDADFVASDIIQVAFRTNGLWRNAAASISLEYTE